MKSVLIVTSVLLAAAHCGPAARAGEGPFDGKTFKGRIAYSADGNFNDPDDWAASPVALAIFAQAGLKDRLVHFDYNNIIPRNDPEWERTHAKSVLGAAERYGFDLSAFHDCQKDLDAALASITRAVNASSAEDPLYFILAGPMEVPFRGIERSDREKRRFVYCISHSRWNDGFSSARRHDFFTYNKRAVIESGVNWVQIQDQNRLLSNSPYGRPARPEQFAPYFWMRDSNDAKVRFLWEQLLISTRPDPSDSGMAWFLVTGDDEADPEKYRRLIINGQVPLPIAERGRIRLEAEDFRDMEGYALEDRNDRAASHRLGAAPTRGSVVGMIRTRFDQPYAADRAAYDVNVRYFDEKGQRCKLTLSMNGEAQDTWETTGTGEGWTTRTVRNLGVSRGALIAIEAEGDLARLDYVELSRQAGTAPAARSEAAPPATGEHPRFRADGPLDDPAALPGQVIVAGSKPGYLKHNGGKAVFLCGPDNPEDFLYIGKLNPDGTRTGPQQEMIDVIAQSGVNACHVMMWRMNRTNQKNEGDDTHCPFVNHDPAQPLNEKVLDQWDGWLTQLERFGVIVHLEFYDDSTDVRKIGWGLDGSGELHPDEQRWITGIVNRFKHHKNILWSVEESGNKLPRSQVAYFHKVIALIARTDEHHHPIVMSFVTPDTSERDLHPDGVMSDAYRDNPHVDIVTWLHVLPCGEDYQAQHREYLKWAARDSDRFISMRNETEYHKTSRTTSRIHNWACALAGMHAFEAQLNAGRRDRRDRLPDAGKVVSFMEQTDWYKMNPHDELRLGSTTWVLADPRRAYIAYTYNYSAPMGLKGMAAGTYDFLWFDAVTGRSIEQKAVSVPDGEATWTKPESLGSEVALYVRQSGASP